MIEVDSSQIDQILNTLLDDQQVNNIIYKSLKAGATVLRDNTKSFFRKAVGGVAGHPNRWTGKPLEDGIRVGKGEKAYLETSVNIMGDFRLKWFEKGSWKSGERWTKGKGKKRKKPHKTGVFVARPFFKPAVGASAEDVETAIRESIDNSLKKIWN